MGERVVIHDEPPLASETPPQGVPLGYGRGDSGGDAWRWIVAHGRAWIHAFEELLKILIPLLGGWRQILFALGLAFCLGGAGYGFDRYGGEAPFMMFVGGFIIGLVIRVPLLKG